MSRSEQELTVRNRMAAAVADSIDALQMRPADAGIAELARLLAEQIDDGVAGGRPLEVLHKLTPRLAGVLRDLGATPAAAGRGRPAGGDDDEERDLDGERELRDLERDVSTRAERAAGVDPATA